MRIVLFCHSIHCYILTCNANWACVLQRAVIYILNSVYSVATAPGSSGRSHSCTVHSTFAMRGSSPTLPSPVGGSAAEAVETQRHRDKCHCNTQCSR